MENFKNMFKDDKISGGGVEWYKEKIVDMISQIEDENYLLKIYSYIKVFFED